MKLKLFFLSLLFSINSFCQGKIDTTLPSTQTDSIITKEVKGKVKTTTTEVTTKSIGLGIDKKSITIEHVTSPDVPIVDGKDGHEKTIIITETQIIDNVGYNPIIETNYDKYKNATIKILKSEVENYMYKITYFDLKDLDTHNCPKLKIFKNKIQTNDMISNTQYGWRIYRPHILTVPFKIRPKTNTTPQIAKADINNVGVFFPFWQLTSKRFFPDNSSSEHRWSAGLHFCPIVETYNADNTEPDIEKEVTNLGISMGVALTYSYNDITFALIPCGLDYGKKDWIYNVKYWYGFGIGLDLKILDKVKGD